MCCETESKKTTDLLHKHGQQENVLENHSTIWQEIQCHLPYAIFSVALAIMVLSFMSYSSNGRAEYRLFHSFHFLHILFAATGTVLMFRKYSKNIKAGIFAGFFIPTIFCTISDTMLPFLGGKLLNLKMSFHWCFLSHFDTVLTFLVLGVINGWVMSNHEASRQLFYSIGFHFFHIFISSMASILYLVSFGLSHWWSKMGFVFGYIILVVLIPCTLADIVIPIVFARQKLEK